MDVTKKLVELDLQKQEEIKHLYNLLTLENWQGIAEASWRLRELETKVETILEQAQIATAEEEIGKWILNNQPKTDAPKSYCDDCNCGKAEGCK